jgi:TRAP-type C4-dicarboxylate transport system permease small subunit
MSISYKIKKTANFIYNNVEGILLVVLSLLLVVDVLLGILARYVHFETIFATELGKYLFIWLSAVGISAAVKDRQHVRLTLFVEKLPVPRKITWVISQLLFLAFSLFFVYWGAGLVIFHIAIEKSAMGFNFPVYVFTAALPVGFALTALRLSVNIVNTIRGKYSTPPWESDASSGLGGISK